MIWRLARPAVHPIDTPEVKPDAVKKSENNAPLILA
jgi:hypothetical protein